MRQWMPLCFGFFLVVDNGDLPLQADPDKWERQWAGLGETLEGNELVLSDYDVKCVSLPFFLYGVLCVKWRLCRRFGQDVPSTIACAQVNNAPHPPKTRSLPSSSATLAIARLNPFTFPGARSRRCRRLRVCMFRFRTSCWC
jgi:hypothetical protein